MCSPEEVDLSSGRKAIADFTSISTPLIGVNQHQNTNKTSIISTISPISIVMARQVTSSSGIIDWHMRPVTTVPGRFEKLFYMTFDVKIWNK